MKKVNIALLLLFSFGTFAQVTKDDLDKEIKPLTEKVRTLQSENSKLKSELGNLNLKLSNSNKNLGSLKNEVEKTKQEFGSKISNNEQNTDKKITAVDKSLNKNSLYGIIGVLLASLLSGFLYWLLNKKQKTDKIDIIDQLNKTKSSIEESLVKEFGKQTDLMDLQLHLIEQQKKTLKAMPNAELDHTLALKVASEINLIERNINLMDTKTKGLRQLQASLGRLKDNLSANGYEMPELLGKQFHQGMRVIVTSSIPDENIEKGSEVISKILIPQVNYNNKMIQTAHIEVSVG